MTPVFSIVIPTFQRPDTLGRVLDGLARQISAPEFEVVVVDDGSRDETPRVLASLSPPFPFRFFRQENSGPAAARNRGITEARGRTILFLGDDIVPEDKLVSVHAEAHGEPLPHPVAVLGYTTWPRGSRVSAFLHHINEYGLQFGYSIIEDPDSVPFNFFYTSNISVPRALLLSAGLFDTTFPHAAWEDIEIAYRMSKLGMRILYRPEAVARHYHDISFASFRRRQEKSGEAAAIFYEKHPELGAFLAVPQALGFEENGGLKDWTARAWAALSEKWDLPGARRALDHVLRRDYLRGLSAALKRRGERPSPAATVGTSR